ncbi:MAG TPA: hypothetical protein VIO57_18270, partial [Chloroflexota bacterium]
MREFPVPLRGTLLEEKGRSASGSQMERKRWSTTRVDATNVCVWGSGDRENFRRSLPCVLAAPHLVQIERVETKTPTGTSATESAMPLRGTTP